MFFCEPCQRKKEWPKSLALSVGKCEVCGVNSVCYDIDSKFLKKYDEGKETGK
jgi:hypothetical protein